MTNTKLYLAACLGTLLGVHTAFAQTTSQPQLPPRLPATAPSHPLPSPSSADTLAVPVELSGLKSGNSETAVEVTSTPKLPAVPAPLGVQTAAHQAATTEQAVQQTSIAAESDPAGQPVTLASSQTDQGITGNRVSANSVSFTKTDGPFQNKPSIQTLTATTGTKTPSLTRNVTATQASDSDTSFESTGPTIRVRTAGPRSIAINKPALYEIQVQNTGSVEAHGINVGASFPEYIELLSARPTAGNHEHTPDATDGRLKWRIDHLAAGKTETLKVNLTPREAQLFDFQVQWATDPIRGFSTIEITEPKLEMNIAGPSDVLYGEKAIYTITIRNPGTGVAENVEIMLSEELGGQRASVGNIQPSSERSFEVELIPGEAGNLQLEAFASAENLENSVAKEIMVRRANLEIEAQGAAALYAGTSCTYDLVVRNTGDAIARDVIAATVLPAGATYVSGIEGAEQVETGLRWAIGAMAPGTERKYQIECILNQPGDLRLEAGVRGAGDLAATNVVATRVEALADLVLSVEDPKGPLPIEKDMVYTIRVKNRGTKAAYDIQLAMQFSEGIEPVNASGMEYRIEPGQITFKQIDKVDVGQEVLLKVVANASQSGTHIFRAVLNGTDPKTEESAQGTTKFFGSEITSSIAGPQEGSHNKTGGILDSSLRR